MLKKMLILILAVMMCISNTVNVFAAEDTVPGIEINGKNIELAAKVWDGELFLPLRAVSEELEFVVQWDGGTKVIKVYKTEKGVTLNLADSSVWVNGHDFYIAGGYRIVDGRTYLRQDFFSDNLGLNVAWDKDSNRVILQGVKENPVIISTEREFSETQTLKMIIQYPKLSGSENTVVQEKLNSLFVKLASEAKDRAKEAEKYIGQDEITRHIKAEAFYNYQVKYNQNGMLSVVFLDYQYSGGAHGGTVQTSYTFDLKTGAEYELKDLFKDGSDYVSVISSEVKRQMEEREMTMFLAPFDSIKAEQDFYLSNNGVVIYFQQYEYFPYAMGIPEFLIDFPFIRENGGIL